MPRKKKKKCHVRTLKVKCYNNMFSSKQTQCIVITIYTAERKKTGFVKNSAGCIKDKDKANNADKQVT